MAEPRVEKQDGGGPIKATKKILFTTLASPGWGQMARSLPIAEELRARGHRVVFCSPARGPGRRVEEAGFENLIPRHGIYPLIAGRPGAWRPGRPGNLGRDLGGLVSWVERRLRRARAEVWDVDHLMVLYGMASEELVRALVEPLIGLMEGLGPEVVVDFGNPFAAIAARASGRPLVSVIRAELHPQSEGFIWWKPLPLERPSPAAVVNRVLADHGLAPIERVGELWLHGLTLTPGTPESDPLPRTAQVTYVGAIRGQEPEGALPEALADLSSQRPVIWVDIGRSPWGPGWRSPGEAGILWRAVREALGEAPVQVILSTGRPLLPRTWGRLPSNFRHLAQGPGQAMAARSDLLIHQGDYGLCQLGLSMGTPAVTIPACSERESNGRRVAGLGAGEVLPLQSGVSGKRQRLGERLGAAVKRVLSDPAFTLNARAAGEVMRQYGGARQAADVIGGERRRRGPAGP